jgi:hypothetical protein
VNDTILVDGVVPTISQLSPAHNEFDSLFPRFLKLR